MNTRTFCLNSIIHCIQNAITLYAVFRLLLTLHLNIYSRFNNLSNLNRLPRHYYYRDSVAFSKISVVESVALDKSIGDRRDLVYFWNSELQHKSERLWQLQVFGKLYRVQFSVLDSSFLLIKIKFLTI